MLLRQGVTACRIITASLLATLLAMISGCQYPARPADTSMLDYQLLDARTGHPLALSTLAAQLEDTRVLFVGEWHTHPAIHRFEAQLLRRLHQHQAGWQLSMEQFDRPAQPWLNRYLSGNLDTQTLIRQGNAWDNYPSDYRPLVDFARAQKLAVVATNAPRPLVHCVYRQGLTYLDSLPPATRALLARQIHLDTPAYREKFLKAGAHGAHDSAAAGQRRFAAQALRDDTMAESLVAYLASRPHQRLLHITGSFHVAERLGTVERLARRRPDWNTRVIVPVTPEALAATSPTDRTGLGDYLLLVKPLPPQSMVHRPQAATTRSAPPSEQCLPP